MAVSNTGMTRLGGLGGFLFGAGTNQSYEDLQRRRKRTEDMAARIMGKSPKTALEGIGAMLQGAALGIDNWRTDKALGEMDDQRSELRDRLFASITGMPYSPPPGGYGGSSSGSSSTSNLPSPGAGSELAATDSGNSSLPSSFLSAVDRTEGAGGYNTLYGNAERNGPFAGVDVSQMSVGDALAFADPHGPYAQSVKGQIGRVATPMGRHQIVGTTLRNAANEMGLDPSTPFNAETQDNIALHLAKRRVASASTIDGKIEALRNEWAGFKNVPRQQMEQIVADIEAGGQGGTQVASLDPSAGMSGAAAIEEMALGSGYVDPSVSGPNASQPAPAFDAGRFADPINLAEMPANRADLPGGLQSQASAYAAQPQNQPERVTGALPSLPSAEVAPSPFVASVPPQQGTQVAQSGQGYFPPAPASPSVAPPSIDPGWFQLYNDPGATAQDRAMAGMMIQRHMEASDPSKRLDLEYRQAQIDEARAKAQRAAAGGGEEYFGSTIPYYDQDGNLRYRQLGKNGVGKDLDFGPGASAAPPSRTIDNGLWLITLGPGGQEISRTRKDVSGVAEQGAYGKEVGAARASLPQVESSANELLSSIDSLATDPYLGEMLGPWNSRMKNLSADSERVQSKINQIGGQAFMQAYNSLRGAGQITEEEGKRATEAMGRLSVAQNEKDYRDALNELRGVVQRSLDSARRKAAGSGEAPAMPAPGNNRGQTTGGVGWSIEN